GIRGWSHFSPELFGRGDLVEHLLGWLRRIIDGLLRGFFSHCAVSHTVSVRSGLSAPGRWRSAPCLVPSAASPAANAASPPSSPPRIRAWRRRILPSSRAPGRAAAWRHQPTWPVTPSALAFRYLQDADFGRVRLRGHDRRCLRVIVDRALRFTQIVEAATSGQLAERLGFLHRHFFGPWCLAPTVVFGTWRSPSAWMSPRSLGS